MSAAYTDRLVVPALVESAQTSINHEIDTISKLAQEASKYPYYKYNHMWSRQMQDTVSGAAATNLHITISTLTCRNHSASQSSSQAT